MQLNFKNYAQSGIETARCGVRCCGIDCFSGICGGEPYSNVDSDDDSCENNEDVNSLFVVPEMMLLPDQSGAVYPADVNLIHLNITVERLVDPPCYTLSHMA